MAAVLIWTISQIEQGAKMELASLTNFFDVASTIETTEAVFARIDQTAQRVIVHSTLAVLYFVHFFQFMFWLWMMFKVYLTSNLSIVKAVNSFGQFALLGLLIVTCSLKIIAKSNAELATVTAFYVLPSTSIFSAFSGLYALLKAGRVLVILCNAFASPPNAFYSTFYD